VFLYPWDRSHLSILDFQMVLSRQCFRNLRDLLRQSRLEPMTLDRSRL
jgi:hypothetical protein